MTRLILLFLLCQIVVLIITFVSATDATNDEKLNPPRRHYTDIHPVKTDLPLITCGVCKRVVRQLITQMKKPKPSELDYIELMKNLCDPLEDEGFWITELDIVETASALEVRRMNGPGHCEEECKTVAFACKTIVDTADSEIAELLYLNRKGANTPEEICRRDPITSLKGACGTPYPAVPDSRPNRGQNFRPKSKADFENEQKAAEHLLYGNQDTEPAAKKKKTVEDDAGTIKSSNDFDLSQAGIMTEDGNDRGQFKPEGHDEEL